MAKKPGRIFDFYPLEDRILLNGDGLDGADLSVDVDPELMAALLADVEAAGPTAEAAAVAAQLARKRRLCRPSSPICPSLMLRGR